jgi:hypothetical protein
LASYHLPADLSKLTEATQRASEQLASNLAPIALAVVIFFLACGVLYGYLWSRWEVALRPLPSTTQMKKIL